MESQTPVRLSTLAQAVAGAGQRPFQHRDEWLVSRRYLSAESTALIPADTDLSEQLHAEQEVPSLTAA